MAGPLRVSSRASTRWHKLNNLWINMYIYRTRELQCVPRKGFGSVVCLQRDREIVYMVVSQTADPNHFGGAADIIWLIDLLLCLVFVCGPEDCVVRGSTAGDVVPWLRHSQRRRGLLLQGTAPHQCMGDHQGGGVGGNRQCVPRPKIFYMYNFLWANPVRGNVWSFIKPYRNPIYKCTGSR